MDKTITGWAIHVNDADRERALSALDWYFDEADDPSSQDRDLPSTYPRTFSAVWVIILLSAAHATVAFSEDRHDIIRMYGASARHIMDGELYRTVTALFLHGSLSHLAGNSLGLAVFGTAAASVYGWGAGWLMILLTGFAGNLLNAFLYQTGHLAIGASTALFGSIGMLSAYQFVKNTGVRRHRFKAWVYLGAGLALLGFLGSGKYTDVMAHFFGFLAGIVLGGFILCSSNRYQAGAINWPAS